MILCDANIWLALAIEAHVHHKAARRWLDTVDQPHTVHFCRATQHTFLRLLTTHSVISPYGRPPLTNEAAWHVFETLLDDDRLALHTIEPPEIESVWGLYARRDTSSPKLWMDAYLAAYAQVEGFILVTTDTAFRQFSGLDLQVIG